MKNTLLVTVIYLVFAACKSPAEEAKDTYDSVNKSLASSNKEVGHSMQELYLSTQQGNGAMALKVAADSVYSLTQTALNLLAHLKLNLHNSDASGENMEMAEKLLVNTEDGQKLTKALIDVYSITSGHVVDKRRQLKLDTIQAMLKKIAGNRMWPANYFRMVPTIAAITFLTKLQNDCELSAVEALSDLRERMKVGE